MTNYIVGIADRVTVTDAAGNTLRRREDDVDCTTANVTENRGFLADGSTAVTDMTYDGEGKLTNVVGPANLNGERYRLAYTYDTVVRVHVESVTDSFGHVSTSTHDFKFGETTSTTDKNGQVVSNSYDTLRSRRLRDRTLRAGHRASQPSDFSYSPFAAKPWALTRHVDGFRSATDRIETALFTDGFKRVVQTKKDAAVSRPGRNCADRRDGHLGPRHLRPVRAYRPAISIRSPNRWASRAPSTRAFDSVQSTVTAFDILDRADPGHDPRRYHDHQRL